MLSGPEGKGKGSRRLCCNPLADAERTGGASHSACCWVLMHVVAHPESINTPQLFRIGVSVASEGPGEKCPLLPSISQLPAGWESRTGGLLGTGRKAQVGCHQPGLTPLLHFFAQECTEGAAGQGGGGTSPRMRGHPAKDEGAPRALPRLSPG